MGGRVASGSSTSSSVMSEYSTAEINRDLELLTEKVTKLAIEGEWEEMCLSV